MLVPNGFEDRQVCVMGLGYVGLTLAATMADVGFNVLGVEIRPDVIEMLARGEPQFHEPGLRNLMARIVKSGRFRVTRHIPDGYAGRVYVITVGTPLGPDGRARLDMVENVAGEVARHLNDGDMVILRSTVRLGTTRNIVKLILERTGKRFDLLFCPERTIEGRALAELHELPQIVGGFHFQATIRASQIFQFLTPTIVRVGSPETAEMIKLIDNAHRDVQFAYANEVARLCDAAGVSAAEVIRAGKLGYPRTCLPMPGPVGGPCLEKDTYILAEGFENLGVQPDISLAARRLNERQPAEVAEHLAQVLDGWNDIPARPRIALLGIAFKGRPATDDLRGTTARPIYAELQKRFPEAEFVGYDPVVPAPEIDHFGLAPQPSIEAAFAGSSLVLVLNNHPAFGEMPLPALAETLARPGLVYDFWNNFEARDLELPERTGYMALGSHGQAILPEANS